MADLAAGRDSARMEPRRKDSLLDSRWVCLERLSGYNARIPVGYTTKAVPAERR